MANPARLTQRIRTELQWRGLASAAELVSALRISQPTLSRALATMSAEIVRLGHTRSTRYALSQELPGLGSRWPIYRINELGHAEELGFLRSLSGGHFMTQLSTDETTLVQGNFADGLFPGLPWFLADLRPQGFLGRLFARRYGRELGAGDDPRLWNDVQVLTGLLRYGNNLPGDLVLGDSALNSALQGEGIATIPTPEDKAKVFMQLAQAALQGELPGSSAAGEQPKFLCQAQEQNGNWQHFLVKFSPPLTTPQGQRWADLLVCEQLAGQILRQHQVPAAESDWSQDGQRAYLQVRRFDRVGHYGRRGLVSLQALGAAYFGQLETPWTAAADRLQQTGWLTTQHANQLRFLWWFGNAIANSDRHYGNVSLNLTRQRPLSLAPAYDMLPMLFAPGINGELVTRDFAPVLPPPRELEICRQASTAGLQFWQTAQNDERMGQEFRTIAGDCGNKLSDYVRRLATL